MSWIELHLFAFCNEGCKMYNFFKSKKESKAHACFLTLVFLILIFLCLKQCCSHILFHYGTLHSAMDIIRFLSIFIITKVINT